MSFTVSFVERRDPETSSIERLIRVVGDALTKRGVQVRYDKVPYGNSLSGMAANLFAKRPGGADIYHVTGHIHYYALLLPRERTVLTMHDLRILGMRKGLRRYLIRKIFYDLPVRRIKYIVTGSEAAKRDLVRLTGCSPELIHVIGHPITVETREHQRPFDEAKPRILQIGTAHNKNLENLIKGLEGLSCKLLIVGSLEGGIHEALRDGGIDFENFANVSDEEILALYDSADIVSFCSLSEGFGLPIIEAQAMGLPVVTSDRPPMSDVAGGAAFLCDPEDPESIRRAFGSVIADPALRADLVTRGEKNVLRFLPDTIASEYEALYSEVLSKLR